MTAVNDSQPTSQKDNRTDNRTDGRTSVGGAVGRARASLAALETLERLRESGQPATDSDRAVLLGWAGWGSLANAFEPGRTGSWAEIGERIEWLLPPADQIEARKATYSAFYTPPEITRACWQILQGLGFDGGRILEPGCGAGVFMEHTPAEIRDDVHWLGVERDPTTAAIAAALHPNAQILTAPIQKAKLPVASVDAVLGNVPFADHLIYDPGAPEAVRASLHNYSLWRSIQTLRPGGIAVLITSRYTLDAKDASARQMLFAQADLLDAIRLPSTVWQSGGTKVTADILVLRRRRGTDDIRHHDRTWLDAQEVPELETPVNRLFLARPELVVGTMRAQHGHRYGHTLSVEFTPTVTPTDTPTDVSTNAPADAPVAAGSPTWQQGMATAVAAVTAERPDQQYRSWQVDAPIQMISAGNTVLADAEGRQEGSFHIVDGRAMVVVDGELAAVQTRRKHKTGATTGDRSGGPLDAATDDADTAEPDTADLDTAESSSDGIDGESAEVGSDSTSDGPDDQFEYFDLAGRQLAELSALIDVRDAATAVQAHELLALEQERIAQRAEQRLAVANRLQINAHAAQLAALATLAGSRDGQLVAAAPPVRTAVLAWAVQAEATARQVPEERLLAEAERDSAQLQVARIDGELESMRERLNTCYDAYQGRYGFLNRVKISTGKPDEETGLPTITKRRPPIMQEALHAVREGSNDDTNDGTNGGAEPVVVRFRTDPNYFDLLALEDWDTDNQVGRKHKIFTTRVNKAPQRVTRADSASDAVALSLDAHNTLDLPTIAALLDITVEQVPDVLGELAYFDPASREWTERGEYLSGDVRAKLDQAVAAAAQEPARFTRNVEALRARQPRDLGPGEIYGQLGAAWIPEEDVAGFIRELLHPRGQVAVQREPLTSTWTIMLSHKADRSRPEASHEWGTEAKDAYSLIELELNGSVPEVTKTIKENGQKKSVVDSDATAQAKARQKQIATRFSEWLWEDPERADRLAEKYNRAFNATVLRDYDGSHLTVPGMAADFDPYASQRDMVFRAISNKTALCGHAVGGGKTTIMAMTAVKLRQLGLANKPMIVVLKATLEDIAREIKQRVPAMNLLVADENSMSDWRSRALWAKRCASGDYDAVIITHPAFTKISMHEQFQADYLAELAASYRASLTASMGSVDAEDNETGPSDRRVKQVEKLIASLEARAEYLLEHATDDGIAFEHLGVDYLLVDEFHYFKNLQVPCHTEGFSMSASKRATDLDMKLSWLRSQRDRVATFFSGTPVSNSMLELYVVLHYLMPERLEELGMSSPDAWARWCVQFEENLEIAPDGQTPRTKRRPSRFKNVYELLMLLNERADIRSKKQLGLLLPPTSRSTEVVARSRVQEAFVASLAARAEAVKGKPPRKGADNILNIATDGRKGAIDPELVGLFDPSAVKFDKAIDNLVATYRATRDLQFPADSKHEADVVTGQRGGFQLVFCDLGTPAAKNKKNAPAAGSSGGSPGQVYAKIRDGLVAEGVPRERIRFIHDAKSDQQRAQLFAACRTGDVSVLIASTEKGGVGVNVQDRMVRIHHVDAPWRPSDIEQREGRGERPGNRMVALADLISQMEERGEPVPENWPRAVEITAYVSEGTFDSFMWGKLEYKAGFISQLLGGRIDPSLREIEDVGTVTMNFAEVKALATGNELLMDLAKAEQQFKVLHDLAAAHTRTQRRLDTEIARYEKTAATQDATVRALDAVTAAAQAGGTDQRGFFTHNGDPIADDDLDTVLAEVAAQAATARNDAKARRSAAEVQRGVEPIGKANQVLRWQSMGLTFEVRAHGWRNDMLYALVRPNGPRSSVNQHRIELNLQYLNKGQHFRIRQALDKFLATCADQASDLRANTTELRDRVDAGQRQVGKPFPQLAELEAARTEVDRLKTDLESVKAEVSAERGGQADQATAMNHRILNLARDAHLEAASRRQLIEVLAAATAPGEVVEAPPRPRLAAVPDEPAPSTTPGTQPPVSPLPTRHGAASSAESNSARPDGTDAHRSEGDSLSLFGPHAEPVATIILPDTTTLSETRAPDPDSRTWTGTHASGVDILITCHNPALSPAATATPPATTPVFAQSADAVWTYRLSRRTPDRAHLLGEPWTPKDHWQTSTALLDHLQRHVTAYTPPRALLPVVTAAAAQDVEDLRAIPDRRTDTDRPLLATPAGHPVATTVRDAASYLTRAAQTGNSSQLTWRGVDIWIDTLPTTPATTITGGITGLVAAIGTDYRIPISPAWLTPADTRIIEAIDEVITHAESLRDAHEAYLAELTALAANPEQPIHTLPERPTPASALVPATPAHREPTTSPPAPGESHPRREDHQLGAIPDPAVPEPGSTSPSSAARPPRQRPDSPQETVHDGEESRGAGGVRTSRRFTTDDLAHESAPPETAGAPRTARPQSAPGDIPQPAPAEPAPVPEPEKATSRPRPRDNPPIEPAGDGAALDGPTDNADNADPADAVGAAEASAVLDTLATIDTAEQWRELSEELRIASYRHVRADHVGLGGVDHDERTVRTDAGWAIADELVALARYVAEVRERQNRSAAAEVADTVLATTTSATSSTPSSIPSSSTRSSARPDRLDVLRALVAGGVRGRAAQWVADQLQTVAALRAVARAAAEQPAATILSPHGTELAHDADFSRQATRDQTPLTYGGIQITLMWSPAQLGAAIEPANNSSGAYWVRFPDSTSTERTTIRDQLIDTINSAARVADEHYTIAAREIARQLPIKLSDPHAAPRGESDGGQQETPRVEVPTPRPMPAVQGRSAQAERSEPDAEQVEWVPASDEGDSSITKQPAAEPPQQVVRTLTFHYSFDRGVMLLGTDRTDGIADLLRPDRAGWKWRRVDAPTGESGAWLLPKTLRVQRDPHAMTRFHTRLYDRMSTAGSLLIRAGFAVQLDLHDLPEATVHRLQAWADRAHPAGVAAQTGRTPDSVQLNGTVAPPVTADVPRHPTGPDDAGRPPVAAPTTQPELDEVGLDIPASGGTRLAPELLTMLADHGWVGSGFIVEHGTYPAPKPHSYSSDWRRGQQRLEITWTSAGVVDACRLGGREVPLTFTALRAAITSPDPALPAPTSDTASASDTVEAQAAPLVPVVDDALNERLRAAYAEMLVELTAAGYTHQRVDTVSEHGVDHANRTVTTDPYLPPAQEMIVLADLVDAVRTHRHQLDQDTHRRYADALAAGLDPAVAERANHLLARAGQLDALARRTATAKASEQPFVIPRDYGFMARLLNEDDLPPTLFGFARAARRGVSPRAVLRGLIPADYLTWRGAKIWFETGETGLRIELACVVEGGFDTIAVPEDWLRRDDGGQLLVDAVTGAVAAAARRADEMRLELGALLAAEGETEAREQGAKHGAFQQVADTTPAVELPTLRGLRAMAAEHGLQVRVVRVADAVFVTAHEPAAPTPPVLSWPVGTAQVVDGAGRPLPVETVAEHMAAYRSVVDPEWFAGKPGVRDWARRLAQLTPYLPPGPAQRPTIRQALDEVLAAENPEEVEGLLRRAEDAAGSVTLTPEREAQVVREIRDHASGYAWTGQVGRNLIDPGHLNGTFQEWDWIEAYVAEHPEVLRGLPNHDAIRARNAAEQAEQQKRGDALFRESNVAYRADEFERTLDLLDQAELAHPGDLPRWSRARGIVAKAITKAMTETPTGETTEGTRGRQDEPGGTEETAEPTSTDDTRTEPASIGQRGAATPVDRASDPTGDDPAASDLAEASSSAASSAADRDVDTAVADTEGVSSPQKPPVDTPSVHSESQGDLAGQQEQTGQPALSARSPQRPDETTTGAPALPAPETIDSAADSTADPEVAGADHTTALAVGDRVQSEYGTGEVVEYTRRGLTYRLDTGETLHVAVGTPGYYRLRKATTPDINPEKVGDQQSAAGAETALAAHIDSGLVQPGPWARRIEIEVTGNTAVVSGTSGGDPQVLRQALKDNGFRWRPQEGQVWKYVYRRGGPSRDDAVQALRDVLAELDATEAAKAVPAPTYPPTPQQQAIIDACLAGDNVAVRALAGTGKTSTMRMVAARMPDKQITYIAFNRSIADEAQAAFGRNVRADTMHAFARQALRSNPRYQTKLGAVATNDGFPQEIAAGLGLDPDGEVTYGPHGSDSVPTQSLVRMALGAVKRFRESADTELRLRHVDGGAEDGDRSGLREVVLEHARRIWADKTNPTGQLRFTHDDYLKIWALGNPTIPGDVIIFDEVQDVNELQARLVQAQAAQTVVVGDSYQSIYGFRGAKDFLRTWPAEVTLPLTQSWRFGSVVADTGNRFLRLLRATLVLEGNPALDTRLERVENPDAVLCRTNAAAVAAVFSGMEDGKRVALVGGGSAIKDIARAAQDLQRGRGTRHPDLNMFASWQDVRDYVKQHEDAQSLTMFVRLVDKHGPEGLIAMADHLVDEDETDPDLTPNLVVSTAHKAKGREWHNVRIADDFKGPTEDEDTGETIMPSPEELRLAYVTVTRAQRRLDLGSLEWVLGYGEPRTQQPAAVAAGWRRTHQNPAPEADSPTDSQTDIEPDVKRDALPVTSSDQMAVSDQMPVSDEPPEPASARAPEATSPPAAQTSDQPSPATAPATAPAEPSSSHRGDGTETGATRVGDVAVVGSAAVVSDAAVGGGSDDGLFSVSDFERKPLRLLDPYTRTSAVGRQLWADVRVLSPAELEHRWRVLSGHARSLGREVVRTGAITGSHFDEDGNIGVQSGIDPRSAVQQLEDAIVELVGGPIEVGQYDDRLAQARQDGTLPTIAECLTGEPPTPPEGSDPNALVRWVLKKHRPWPFHYQEKYEVWNSLLQAVSGAGFTEIESTTGTVEVDHDRALISIPKFWTRLSNEAAAEAVLAMATAVAHAHATRHAQILNGARDGGVQGPRVSLWQQRWKVLMHQAAHQGLQALSSTVDKPGNSAGQAAAQTVDLAVELADDQTITVVDSDREARNAPGEQWRLDAALPLRDRVIWLSRRLAADPPPVMLIEPNEHQEAHARNVAELDASQDQLPFLADLPVADVVATGRETPTGVAHGDRRGDPQAVIEQAVGDVELDNPTTVTDPAITGAGDTVVERPAEQPVVAATEASQADSETVDTERIDVPAAGDGPSQASLFDLDTDLTTTATTRNRPTTTTSTTTSTSQAPSPDSAGLATAPESALEVPPERGREMFEAAVAEAGRPRAETAAAGGHKPIAWLRFSEMTRTDPRTGIAYSATQPEYEAVSQWWIQQASTALNDLGYRVDVRPNEGRRRYREHQIEVDHAAKVIIVDAALPGTHAFNLVQQVADLRGQAQDVEDREPTVRTATTPTAEPATPGTAEPVAEPRADATPESAAHDAGDTATADTAERATGELATVDDGGVSSAESASDLRERVGRQGVARPARHMAMSSRQDVYKRVLGDRHRDKDLRRLVQVVVSGRVYKGLSVQAAREQLAAADPEMYRRALAASVGQPQGREQFDVARAQQTLERLAEGDPALPLNSIGQYIEFEDWFSDVRDDEGAPLPRGVVVGVQAEPSAGNFCVVSVERNVPNTQGDLEGDAYVPFDAELTLLDPSQSPPSARRRSTRDATPSPIQESRPQSLSNATTVGPDGSAVASPQPGFDDVSATRDETTGNELNAARGIADAALAWWDAGCSVVRVETDGSKRPLPHQWAPYQRERATREQVVAWFKDGHPGVGVVTGAVSGGLEMFEFEGRAIDEDLLGALRERMDAAGHRELWERLMDAGYLERSPSGGIHVLYRVEGGVDRNTKLAQREARDNELTDDEQTLLGTTGRRARRVLVETRGEGGFVVVAPSHGPVHDSGRAWEVLEGAPATIPTITAAERDIVHMAARDLDQIPAPPPIPEPTPRAARDTERVRPGEDFNQRASWRQVLEPHGWVAVGGDSTRTYWRRPGKDRGISAVSGGDRGDYLWVFSTSTALPSEEALSLWRAYGLLNHAGDFSAAARALAAAGYGERSSRSSSGRRAPAGGRARPSRSRTPDGRPQPSRPAPAGNTTGHHGTGQRDGDRTSPSTSDQSSPTVDETSSPSHGRDSLVPQVRNIVTPPEPGDADSITPRPGIDTRADAATVLRQHQNGPHAGWLPLTRLIDHAGTGTGTGTESGTGAASSAAGGHQLHIATRSLAQVREAARRIWPVVTAYGLGLDAAIDMDTVTDAGGAGVLVHLPRTATLDRDTTAVVAALDGFRAHPDPMIPGTTPIAGAVSHSHTSQPVPPEEQTTPTIADTSVQAPPATAAPSTAAGEPGEDLFAVARHRASNMLDHVAPDAIQTTTRLLAEPGNRERAMQALWAGIPVVGARLTLPVFEIVRDVVYGVTWGERVDADSRARVAIAAGYGLPTATIVAAAALELDRRRRSSDPLAPILQETSSAAIVADLTAVADRMAVYGEFVVPSRPNLLTRQESLFEPLEPGTEVADIAEPSAVEPSAVEPSAVESGAVEPRAVGKGDASPAYQPRTTSEPAPPTAGPRDASVHDAVTVADTLSEPTVGSAPPLVVVVPEDETSGIADVTDGPDDPAADPVALAEPADSTPGPLATVDETPLGASKTDNGQLARARGRAPVDKQPPGADPTAQPRRRVAAPDAAVTAPDRSPRHTAAEPTEPDPGVSGQRPAGPDAPLPGPPANSHNEPATTTAPAPTTLPPQTWPVTQSSALVTLRERMSASRMGWPRQIDTFLETIDPFTAQDLLREIARATDNDPHTQVLVAMAWRASHGQVTTTEISAFADRLIAADPSLVGNAVGRTVRDSGTGQLREIDAVRADLEGRVLLRGTVADSQTTPAITLTTQVDPDAWLDPTGHEILPASEAVPLLRRWAQQGDQAGAYGYTVEEQPGESLVRHDERRIVVGADSLATRVNRLADLTEQIVALHSGDDATRAAMAGTDEDTRGSLDPPAPPPTAVTHRADAPSTGPAIGSGTGLVAEASPGLRSRRRDAIDRIDLVPADSPATEPLADQLAMARHTGVLRIDEPARLAISYLHRILRGPAEEATHLAQTVINVGHRGEAEQVAAQLAKLADKIDAAGFTTPITGATTPLTVHLRTIATHVYARLTSADATPPLRVPASTPGTSTTTPANPSQQRPAPTPTAVDSPVTDVGDTITGGPRTGTDSTRTSIDSGSATVTETASVDSIVDSPATLTGHDRQPGPGDPGTAQPAATTEVEPADPATPPDSAGAHLPAINLAANPAEDLTWPTIDLDIPLPRQPEQPSSRPASTADNTVPDRTQPGQEHSWSHGEQDHDSASVQWVRLVDQASRAGYAVLTVYDAHSEVDDTNHVIRVDGNQDPLARVVDLAHKVGLVDPVHGRTNASPTPSTTPHTSPARHEPTTHRHTAPPPRPRRVASVESTTPHQPLPPSMTPIFDNLLRELGWQDDPTTPPRQQRAAAFRPAEPLPDSPTPVFSTLMRELGWDDHLDNDPSPAEHVIASPLEHRPAPTHNEIYDGIRRGSHSGHSGGDSPSRTAVRPRPHEETTTAAGALPGHRAHVATGWAAETAGTTRGRNGR